MRRKIKPVEEESLWAEGKQTAATRKADKKLAKFAENAEAGRCYTLHEIAEVMGITRERVRQIEARALRKLYKRLGQILRNENVTPAELMAIVRNAAKETGVPEMDMPPSK
tara:strand:- start:2909 stop:3241 length:333 start_codon:yes stop_codon:yes gene_type:complete